MLWRFVPSSRELFRNSYQGFLGTRVGTGAARREGQLGAAPLGCSPRAETARSVRAWRSGVNFKRSVFTWSILYSTTTSHTPARSHSLALKSTLSVGNGSPTYALPADCAATIEAGPLPGTRVWGLVASARKGGQIPRNSRR